MLPLSVVVEGVPVSLQTRNKNSLAAWKKKVRAAAITAASGDQPVTARVSVVVTHYYDVGGPDVDNIIKPIQDAIAGVVYLDDDQVDHTSSRRRSLNGSYKIVNADAAILQGFANGTDFVHIRIAPYVDNRDLTK